MRRLLVAILVLLVTIGMSNHSEVATAQETERAATQVAKDLQVQILGSKNQYKLNEQFGMLVMLVNSGKKDIYVLGTLEWGHAASLLFHILDDKSTEITPRAFPDDQTLVRRGDNSAFIKLRPSHFLGTNFYAPLDLLGIDKPGKYSIFVEYHSPLSSADVNLHPFWGKENKTIRSSPLSFEVVP